MKSVTINSLAYIFFVLVIYGCSEKEVALSTLVEREGVKYEINEDNPYSGKVFEQYESKQFKIIGHYADGLQTGTWEFYNPNGQVVSRAEYQKGKLDGLTENFNEQGLPVSIISYSEGEYDGEFKRFNDEGILSEEGDFIKGKKDGVHKKYKGEKLWSSETYRDGLLDGPSEFFYESGTKMSSGIFVQNQKHGTWTEYYDGEARSKELGYEMGILAQESQWYENGKLQYKATYPGTTEWFSTDEVKVAEAHLTDPTTLGDPSTLKILVDSNWIVPYAILNESYWETEKQNLDMQYQNTRKIDYHHKLRFIEGRYVRHKQFRNGYGYTGSSLINAGKWSFVVEELPRLYLQIVPDTKDCRECESETLSLFDISEEGILLDETKFNRVNTEL